MVTRSEFSMFSSMVFALTNFLSFNTCNCLKIRLVFLSFFSSNISTLSRLTGTSLSSGNRLSCFVGAQHFP